MQGTLNRRLRSGAEQLREDSADCWGVRRKLNLKAAAKVMDEAADALERATAGKVGAALLLVAFLVAVIAGIAAITVEAQRWEQTAGHER